MTRMTIKAAIASILLAASAAVVAVWPGGGQEFGLSPIILEPEVRISELVAGRKGRAAARIKASEMAKIPIAGTYEDGKTGVTVAIEGIRDVGDGAIAVYARAYRGGKQLGFGPDGSVDIERFVVHDPPIYVPSDTETVIKTTIDGETAMVPKMVEDPKKAILMTVAHSASVAGKEGTKIEPGKRGNTTSTFFPALGDNRDNGYIRYGFDASWDTVHDAATGDDIQEGSDDIFSGERRSSGGLFGIRRGWATFDTSSLGSDTIDSAVLSLYAWIVTDQDNDAQAYINIVDFTPASSTNAVVEDYDQFGTTKLSSDVDITGVSTSAYTDFTLNATGEGLIDGAAYTELGMREGHDIEDIPTSLGASQGSRVYWFDDGASGTTQDPKLVITHTASSARRVIITQ